MKLEISTEDMNLKLDSTNDLEFQDFFKVYNLVTHSNDDLSVTEKDDEKPQTDHADVMDTKKSEGPVNKFDSNVKASIRCRKCGFVGVHEVRMGLRYTYCPSCHVKLFLRPANVEWGAKDARGMTYRAEDVYIEKDHNFSNSNNDSTDSIVYSTKEENVPDEFSTINEIKEYLDKHHVDHSGIHMKALLLDKLKDVKYSDK